tara:strand:+ start:526 stop:735 length:210 start_codon:yes stop_codon:yes gene_type:complete
MHNSYPLNKCWKATLDAICHPISHWDKKSEMECGPNAIINLEEKETVVEIPEDDCRRALLQRRRCDTGR